MKNTQKKNRKKTSMMEKIVYIIALTFVFILPFSLLYIESQKLEIADQTEKTKIALGKERVETSKHEVKLSTMSASTETDGKVKNESKRAN